MPAVLVVLGVAAAYIWIQVWRILPTLALLVFLPTVAWFVGRYLLLAWRVLTSGRPDGPSPVRTPPAGSAVVEPAFRSYFFDQAWRDHLMVLRQSVASIVRPGMVLAAGVTQAMVGGPQAVGLAPVWLAAAVGLLAAVAVGVVAVVAFTAAHLAVAGVAVALVAAGATVVRGVERLVAGVRRITLSCPHPGCYRTFVLPEYLCPNGGCRVRHRKLVPGSFGVFRRSCRCGTRLPTAVVLGRHRLAASCPHCHRKLPQRIGRAPVAHVPIVGGPAAGKTTYTCLAIGALRARSALRGDTIRFVDDTDAREFNQALAQLTQDRRLPGTRTRLPRATMLDITSAAAAPPGDGILYVYDPAGEYYAGADGVAAQRYLDQARSLLLVVDPLALAGVRRSLATTERRLTAEAPPSTEEPAHTVQRLFAALRARPGGASLDRLAIVVTKTDVVRRTGVGRPLGGASDGQVRAWLDSVGWGNALRTLDRSARSVRYFVSGLDVDADLLAEPLCWLAETSLAHRRFGRADRRPDRPATWQVHTRSGPVPPGYRAGRLMSLGALLAVAVAGVAGLVAWLGPPLLAFVNFLIPA